MKDIIIVIPSLNPEETLLVPYVNCLVDIGFPNIILVDDGSSDCKKDIFKKCEKLGCKVLTHEDNRGKGAALKTAYRYILKSICSGETIAGVITADSDGQHIAEDVVRIYESLKDNPKALILGTRDFVNAEGIPTKSLFGNRLTSRVFKFLYGLDLKDTQTGLRGIPLRLLKEQLKIKGDRFEYEMNVLVHASYNHEQIVEVPIHTIYFDNNSETHFNHLKDSLKIYVVLLSQFLKYSMSSLMSSLVELAVFQIFV